MISAKDAHERGRQRIHPSPIHVSKRFGQRLRYHRRLQFMSQHELAEVADLDRSYVSDIENGKKAVSLVTLQKIATALGISLHELIHEL